MSRSVGLTLVATQVAMAVMVGLLLIAFLTKEEPEPVVQQQTTTPTVTDRHYVRYPQGWPDPAVRPFH